MVNKLYLSDGSIDLLIGTDFVDAFVGICILSGEPRETIAKTALVGTYYDRVTAPGYRPWKSEQ